MEADLRYKGITFPEEGAATIHQPQPQKGKTGKISLDSGRHCPKLKIFDTNCSGACPSSLTRFKDITSSESLCSIKLPFQAKCVFPNFEDTLRALAEAQEVTVTI